MKMLQHVDFNNNKWALKKKKKQYLFSSLVKGFVFLCLETLRILAKNNDEYLPKGITFFSVLF